MMDTVETSRVEVEHEYNDDQTVKKTTTTRFEPLDHTELPFRGSQVERWIKDWRDKHTHQSEQYKVLDKMIDEYRLHADTGAPLFFQVSEGGEE